MSKVVKEISCIVGQYTNAQGEQKNRYQRIGSVINTKNGEMLKLDVIPLREGGWDGWAYMNEPRPKEDRQPAPQQQRGQSYDGYPDDDIPDFN
jgi:hypothetical protein